MPHHACRQCGEHFTRRSTWIEHLRAHKGIRLYRCVDCDKSFVRERDCKAHQKVHQAGAHQWVCGGLRAPGEPCRYSSLRERDLRRHLMQASAEGCRATTKYPKFLTAGTTPPQMQLQTSLSLISARAPTTVGPAAQAPDRWGLADEYLDESMIDEEITSPLLKEQNHGQRASSRSWPGSADAGPITPGYQRRYGFYIFDLEHVIAPDPMSEMLLEQDAFFDFAGVLFHNVFLSFRSDKKEPQIRNHADLDLLYHTNLFALRRLLSGKDLDTLSSPDLLLVEISSSLLFDLSAALKISAAASFLDLQGFAQQAIYNKLHSRTFWSRCGVRGSDHKTSRVSAYFHSTYTDDFVAYIRNKVNKDDYLYWRVILSWTYAGSKYSDCFPA